MNSMTMLIRLTILLAAAVALGGCGDSQGKASKNDGPSTERAVTVRVQEMHLASFAETIHLTGVVKAYEDVTVSPEEGGTLKTWNYEKGRFVQRGAVIAQLSDDVIRPGYEAALAQYNTSDLTFRKQKQVFDEQAISETQLKTSEYGRDAAKAQADLMKARLERTQVRTPISGILDDRFVDEGEIAPAGVPLARIVNLGAVKLLMSLPERYAGQIRQGTAVDFTVVAYPGQLFAARIRFIGSAISPDNRTFPVEAVLENPGRKLKPDMIARVRILQAVRKQALLLPEDVVQQVDREKLIVFVEREGRAEERHVQLGGRDGNTVEIVTGLKVGDRVIVSGYQSVIDGQPVTIEPGQ